MKRNVLLPIMAWGIAVVLSGCAPINPIPEGSTLLGVYEGSYNGKFSWGDCETKLYRTPNGTIAFLGTFTDSSGDGLPAVFNGQVTNGKMNGIFSQPVDGTVSGELSADGRSMSGTFKISDPPFDHGPWNGQKK